MASSPAVRRFGSATDGIAIPAGPGGKARPLRGASSRSLTRLGDDPEPPKGCIDKSVCILTCIEGVGLVGQGQVTPASMDGAAAGAWGIQNSAASAVPVASARGARFAGGRVL
jgi:hypothetical protein